MPCLPDLLDISPTVLLKGQSRQAKFCLCFSGSLSKRCFAALPFHDPTSLDKGGCRTAATHNWANKKIFPVQPSKMLILIYRKPQLSKKHGYGQLRRIVGQLRRINGDLRRIIGQLRRDLGMTKLLKTMNNLTATIHARVPSWFTVSLC